MAGACMRGNVHRESRTKGKGGWGGWVGGGGGQLLGRAKKHTNCVLTWHTAEQGGVPRGQP